MDSQPLTTPTEPTPMPAPRPAARARALRRRRHPKLRRTGDPKTSWRSREATWNTLPWTGLEASLPQVATAPLTDGRGQEHPFEYVVALDWPTSGALSNTERRAWNLRPLTSSDIENTIDPRELATAFRRTLAESQLGEPEHWDAGTTTLGEWWALRARYPRPPNQREAREPAELAITLRHALGSPTVITQAGLRLPRTGAEILACSYYVFLRNERVRLADGAPYDLMTTIGNQAEATAAIIAAWAEEALLRPALTAWADSTAVPNFGHTTAARLVALHDRRRFSADSPPDERGAPMDTAADIAWAIADELGSIRDIETRIRMQNRLLKSVADLCWQNENDAGSVTAAERVH